MSMPDFHDDDIDGDRRPCDHAGLLFLGLILLPVAALLIYLAAHVAWWIARSL